MKKFEISEKLLKNTLCIGAGIMAVTVVFLSVYAVARSSRGSKNKLDSQNDTTALHGTSDVTTTQKPQDDPDNKPQEPDPNDKEMGGNTDVGEDPENEKLVFVMPCLGVITRPYSPDELIYSSTMNDYRTHDGIDIACELGDDVFAVAAGKVTDVYEDALMGTCVVISHKGDLVSIYKNLSGEDTVCVKVGDTVVSGQKIGKVGSSAVVEISENPHLHVEMTSGGNYIDPLIHIPFEEDNVYEG